MTESPALQPRARAFIVLMGTVSRFGVPTSQGARGLVAPSLALLGRATPRSSNTPRLDVTGQGVKPEKKSSSGALYDVRQRWRSTFFGPGVCSRNGG